MKWQWTHVPQLRKISTCVPYRPHYRLKSMVGRGVKRNESRRQNLLNAHDLKDPMKKARLSLGNSYYSEEPQETGQEAV